MKAKWYSVAFTILLCLLPLAVMINIGSCLIRDCFHLESRYQRAIKRNIQIGMPSAEVERYFKNNNMFFEYESIQELKKIGYHDLLPGQKERFPNAFEGRYYAKFLRVGSGCVAPLSVSVYVFVDSSNRVCGTHTWGAYEGL